VKSKKSRIKLAGEVNHGLRQKRIDKAHHEIGLYLEGGVCVCVRARAQCTMGTGGTQHALCVNANESVHAADADISVNTFHTGS
jgi:hypothetical protein